MHAVITLDGLVWRNTILCADLCLICILIYGTVSGLVHKCVASNLRLSNVQNLKSIAMWGPRVRWKVSTNPAEILELHLPSTSDWGGCQISNRPYSITMTRDCVCF